MLEQTLFCNPGDTYRGMTEEEAAREYTRMAMDEFDSFVSFHEDYKPFQDKPDSTGTARKKCGRELKIDAFLRQRVTKIGRVDGEFVTASYIFSFKGPDKLMLPDLEVVQVKGLSTYEALLEFTRFYESHGWKTEVSDKRIAGQLFEHRERGPLIGLDTTDILQTAVDELKHDMTKLYFG